MSEIVSVIIPTWNREEIIKKAVDSALNQSYYNIEVLVCDDGSTDNTESVVKSIEDERVRWIAGEHSGRPAVPRNKGIKEAKGEWVAFLDSDDEWLPEKLEKQLAAMVESGLMASGTNGWRVINGEVTKEKFIFWNCSRITFNNLLPGNLVMNCSSVVHASLFDLVEGFPEETEFRAIEDYALWLRAATQTDFAFVKEPLVLYSDNPNQSVRSDTKKFKTIHAQVHENFREWAVRNDIPDKFIRKSKNWWLYALPDILPIAVNAVKKFKRNYKEFI